MEKTRENQPIKNGTCAALFVEAWIITIIRPNVTLFRAIKSEHFSQILNTPSLEVCKFSKAEELTYYKQLSADIKCTIMKLEPGFCPKARAKKLV